MVAKVNLERLITYGDRLPCHGQIDGDCVTLLDTEALENIGDAADLTEEFCVGDIPTTVRLIGLVDNRGLYSVIRLDKTASAL